MFNFFRRREFRVIYQNHDHEYYSSTILLARSHAKARNLFVRDKRYANCQCVLTLDLKKS